MLNPWVPSQPHITRLVHMPLNKHRKMEVRNVQDQGHPLLYWLHKKFEASLVSKKKEEKKELAFL